MRRSAYTWQICRVYSDQYIDHITAYMRTTAYMWLSALLYAFFLSGFMQISAYQCLSLHKRLRKKSALPTVVSTPVSWSLDICIVCDGYGGLQNDKFFSFMIQNSQDEPKRVPNGQKQLGWPFWTLLNHFWTLTNLPCLAILCPRLAIFGVTPAIIEGGPQSKTKVNHQVPNVWSACTTPKLLEKLWHNLQKMKEKTVKLPWKNLFCHYLAMNGN